MIFPVKRLADLGFRDPRHRGHRRGAAPQRRRRRGRRQASATAPATTSSSRSWPARSTSSSTRRSAPAARGSTATRSAPPPSPPGIPCMTTVQARRRRVQGIEALVARRHRRALAAGAARPAGGMARRRRWRATPDDGERCGPCRSAARSSSDRRVGAYTQFTVVAPGIAELTQPGHFVAVAVGGADVGDAAAPRVRHLRRARSAASTAARSSSSSPCTARAPRGWPSAGRATSSTSSARSASRSRCRAARSPPCWSAAATAPRRCSRWPRRCASAAAGSTSCSARRPRTGCSASSTPSGWSARSRSPPTTARAGEQRPGHRRAARGASTRTAPTSSTPAGRWPMLRAVGDVAAGARHPRPGRGRGVDGLRHRRVHDLRAAGRRRRRRDPHGALVRRGPGVRRRPGAVGRRRHACRRTLVGADAMEATDDDSPMAAPGPTARRRPAHRLAGHCPNPVLTASGCAAAGRELDQFFDVAALGGVVTKSIMLGAAVRPADAADGRDARAACSTRSACRARASTRSSTNDLRLAAPSTAPARSCRSPAAASTSTSSWPRRLRGHPAWR